MAGREGKRRRPVARQESSFRTILVLTLIPLFALLAYLLYRFAADQIARTKPSPAARAEGEAPPERTPPRKAPPKRGVLVVILDDVGFDNQPLERAMAIDPNISFSVLPNARNARAFAQRLHRRGFEILCHLPMEPMDGGESPGPNAITTAMADAEIVRLTRANLAAVPHARGVNNHMGSRATADGRVMRSVLSSLPEGMYFIDSMTTGNSIGYRVARELKVPTAVRTVFLDRVQEEEAIRSQIRRLAHAAGDDGAAVAIGHMYPVTIDVLEREIPRLRRAGYRVVRAGSVVE
ncbi:MAG TPA: divergent polysaccharide deacetylase family protein [Thermoanaerobaculia bacterium]|nr:divergent polysaccharide deacetylase family protein [Thermoanaerobaculia bacterium]